MVTSPDVGSSLGSLAAAVRRVSQRGTLHLSALDRAGQEAAAADLGALNSAANLLEELAKAALEGERRTRGLKGRFALWLGGMASRLMR